MTGICSGKVLDLDLKAAAKVVKEENARVATLIGINKAARATCIKPEGTASIIVGSSSGIHAWHNDFYIRRVRVGKNEAIYQYLAEHHPELIEDDYFKPHLQAVISVPQKAPEGSIMRSESVFDMLERVKKFSTEWVKGGHTTGQNKHNVSATVSVKEDEWEKVGEWMWNNRKHYNGLAVLPYDGGNYVQAPFEDSDEETYNKMMKTLSEVDLSRIVEEEDNTDLKGEIVCGGGACEVT